MSASESDSAVVSEALFAPSALESVRDIWRTSAFNLIGRGVARPLLLLGIGFAAACAAVGFHSTPVWPGIAVAAVAIFGLWRAGDNRVFLALILLALGFGVGLSRAALASRENAFAGLAAPRLCTAVGSIVTEPSMRPYSASFLLDLQSVCISLGPRTRVSERVSVLVSGKALAGVRALDVGDVIALDGVLDRVSNSSGQTGFDLRQWMAAQGVFAEIRVKRPRGASVLGFDWRFWPARIAGMMRRRSERIFADGLSPSDAAAATAIFLGDKSDLPPAYSSVFSATGTVHLLATAGLHIGILVMVLQFLMRLLTIPRKTSALLGIAMVWLYAGMAGGRPAVVRAAFVASIYFAALILERVPDLLSAVSLCALVLLWRDPREVFDPGFQLTFLTVLGIVALMPALLEVFAGPLSKLKTGWRDRALARFIEVECLSAAAQASAAPVVAVYFNLVTIFGLGANLMAVPLMFVLMPCALASLLAGAVYLPAGAAFARIVLSPVLHLVLGCVSAVARIPHCAIPIPTPSGMAVGCYYFILLGGSFGIQTLIGRSRRDRRGGDPLADDSAGRVDSDPPRRPEEASA